MKNKKLYIIALFALLALAFGLIFLTVFLTGSRDISDFTSRDWRIFIIFIAAEAVCFLFLFLTASQLGRMAHPDPNDEEDAPASDGSSISAVEKILKRRGNLLIAAAAVLSIASVALSAVLPVKTWSGSKTLFWLCMLVPYLLMGINFTARKIFLKKCSRLNVIEIQNSFLSARERARETAEKKLKRLAALRIGGDAFAALLFLSGSCAGAFVVAVGGRAAVIYLYLIFSALLTALTRIRFGAPKKLIGEVPNIVPRNTVPRMYAAADAAKVEMGCTGEVILCVQGGSNVAIYDYEGIYSVELGIQALSLWTEQELYAVFLHEFAHYSPDSSEKSAAESRLCSRLNNGISPHFLRFVYDFMFSFFNDAYNFEYYLYSYAVSIESEAEADRAMLKAGKETAASALLKLSYCNLYDYETLYSPSASIYSSPTVPENAPSAELNSLKEHIEQRRESYNELIKGEILARNATHPTTAMRLEALGVSEYETFTPEADGGFADEVESFVKVWDRLISSDEKLYATLRKSNYLEPMSTVNEWVSAGKPVIAEKYRDILDALEKLCDTDEMLALCDRAIEELSDSASPEAYFRKGIYLLHNFDEAGIDYVYHAVDANRNYAERGLSEIGTYCCLSGNGELLEEYRQRAAGFVQDEIDGGDEINYLKRGDKLSAETLPEGVLEADLAYFASADPRKVIFEIYLVRKTINASLSSSVYVIRFCRGVKDDDKHEIMHRIFNYLDTVSDWQYSLFDYDEVRSARVQNIDGALVYEKAGAVKKEREKS